MASNNAHRKLGKLLQALKEIQLIKLVSELEELLSIKQ